MITVAEHVPEPRIDLDYTDAPYETCRCGAVRRKTEKQWHICKLCATGLPCKS